MQKPNLDKKQEITDFKLAGKDLQHVYIQFGDKFGWFFDNIQAKLVFISSIPGIIRLSIKIRDWLMGVKSEPIDWAVPLRSFIWPTVTPVTLNAIPGA
ncbi:MAG: hypothetical protein Q6370_025905 [Candidatus Sigynarchaeota archaeon]